MAYTVQDLETVRRAIARGERRVQFADRAVDYRSVAELLEAERAIANALGLNTRRKQTQLVADKGL